MFGKTYGASIMVINRFLKKGEQFAYIRRYKPELKKAVPNFFQALQNNNEFKDHLLSSKGNTFYCDGEICRLCNDTFNCSRFKTELHFQTSLLLYLMSLLLKKVRKNIIYKMKL